MQRWQLVLVMIGLLVLLVLVVACGEATAPASSALGVPPTSTWLPVPDPQDETGVALYEQQIRAQQEQQAINATLVAIYAQQTATAEARQVQQTATAQSVQGTATAHWDGATATVQWQGATATAQAWEMTVTASQVQATSTAAAQATATAEARLAAGATATADAILFDLDVQMTRRAMDVTATAETGILSETARLREERLRQVELETEAAERSYLARAYGPWIVLGLVALLVVWAGYTLIQAHALRMRIVERDARGDAPLMLLQQRGALGVVDADRQTGAMVIWRRDGTFEMPEGDNQAEVTRRDQIVDGLTRDLPGRSGATRAKRTKALAQTAPAPVGRVQIVEADTVRPWLEDVRPQALAGALQAAGDK